MLKTGQYWNNYTILYTRKELGNLGTSSQLVVATEMVTLQGKVNCCGKLITILKTGKLATLSRITSNYVPKNNWEMWAHLVNY